MEFLEKDLEQIIFETENTKLYGAGLEIQGRKYRQLRIGNYGIADLVTIERNYNEQHYITQNKFTPKLIVTVYELKKDKIGISAFLQALGYLKGIERYLENERGFNFQVSYNIGLIGRKMDDKSTFCYLQDFIQYDGEFFGLKNYIYNLDIDGLRFERQSSFSQVEEGFKSNLS